MSNRSLKRSLVPVGIYNGERIESKRLRRSPPPPAAPEADAQVVERLHELLHAQPTLEAVGVAFGRSAMLVDALEPRARALLVDMLSGRPLEPAQRELLGTGLRNVMHQSGLFEPVT